MCIREGVAHSHESVAPMTDDLTRALPPIYCTGGCDACRDYARELGVPLIIEPPPIRAALAARSEPLDKFDIAHMSRFEQEGSEPDHEAERQEAYAKGWADARAVIATPPAEGLDVDKVTRLLARYDLVNRPSVYHAHSWGWYRDLAEYIAREYAALAPEQPE
jgi:hypothetical protein